MTNVYVKSLLDAITSTHLPIEERNRRAIVSITAIVSMKPFHQAFVRQMGERETEEMDLDAADENGCIPLHIAVQYGCFDIVAALIANGADTNKRDQSGTTPLIRAVNNCKPQESSSPVIKYHEIVKILLANKADINKVSGQNESPLSWAVYDQHFELVKELLEADANPNTNVLSGESPLEHAIRKQNVKIAEALLSAKISADPNACNSVTGLAPLTIATQMGCAEMVELLLSKKANPNVVPGTNNETPLNQAVKNGDNIIFDLLRHAKANIDDKTLELAIDNKNLFIVSLLLSYFPVLNSKAMDRLNFFLSKQCQNEPAVIDCLEIISSHPFYKDTFDKIPGAELAKSYVKKLKELQEATFNNYYMSHLTAFIPQAINPIICSYMGLFFIADSPVPDIKYLKPETVVPQIQELKHFGRKTSPGIFKPPVSHNKLSQAPHCSAAKVKKSVLSRVFGF